MTLSRKNSVLAQTINVSDTSVGDTISIPSSGIVNISGTLTAISGNFTVLQQNGVGVSASGHAHISSDITDFNNAASLAAPVQTVAGRTGVVTLASSDITNFNTSVSGLLPITNILSGSNILISQSGTTYTVAVTGSLGLSTEEVDDRVASLLVAGSGINLSYNDANNILTVSTTGLQPIGNYSLVGHNHASSDIIDFNSSVSGLLPVINIVGGSNISITPSGSVYTVSTSGLITGSKTLSTFTAMQNQPPATSFATLDTRNSIAVLDFDAATKETAVFVGIMPESANLAGGLNIILHWMATSATSGNVVWEVSLERSNTDLDADSFDTIASATSSTNGTSGIITKTTILLTTIDSIFAGDLYRIKISRDAANGLDTAVGDAELVAIEVRSAA